MVLNPLGPLCYEVPNLPHDCIDSREEAVPEVFRDIVYLLLEPLELLRLRLVDRRRHLGGDAYPSAHRIIEGEDVVLKVARLVIHEINERDGLRVPERLLQLHLLGGVHRFAELAPELLEYLWHT